MCFESKSVTVSKLTSEMLLPPISSCLQIIAAVWCNPCNLWAVTEMALRWFWRTVSTLKMFLKRLNFYQWVYSSNRPFSSAVLLAPSPFPNPRRRTYLLWLKTTWADTVWLLQPLPAWRGSLVCTFQSSSLLERRQSNQPKLNLRRLKELLVMTEGCMFLQSTYRALVLLSILHEYGSLFSEITFLHSLHNSTVHIVLLHRGTLWLY